MINYKVYYLDGEANGYIEERTNTPYTICFNVPVVRRKAWSPDDDMEPIFKVKTIEYRRTKEFTPDGMLIYLFAREY